MSQPDATDRLTADELALRLAIDRAHVGRLAEAGALEPDDRGTFDPGDIHRARLLLAFEEAGVPLEALLSASRSGRISLRYYDELHPPPGRLSGRTYGEFAASLGPGRAHLAQLFAAFGIAEPDRGTHLATGDEALVAELLEIVVASGQPDLALRAVRMFGEGARRAADAALGVYGEAVLRMGDDLTGLPVDAQFERLLRPWARFARHSERLAGWLADRHLTRAIDEYSVVETERILRDTGLIDAPLEAPPAVAFVDLTGFTRLTEERGDETAAAIAMRLGDLATDVARPRGGRVVKLLGDGVLLRFDDAPAAVEGALDLLLALPGAGLPSGHAGIASGPLIARDGDVFGRTVNLAARIADAAPDGRAWVPEPLAGGLPAGRFRLAPTDGAVLQGIGHVPLVDVSRRAAGG